MTQKLIVFIWITGMLCFIMLGILDCQMKEKGGRALGGWAMTDEQKARFNPIAQKHGLLNGDIQMVHEWPGPNAHFIDKKGRRCSFK